MLFSGITSGKLRETKHNKGYSRDIKNNMEFEQIIGQISQGDCRIAILEDYSSQLALSNLL